MSRASLASRSTCRNSWKRVTTADTSAYSRDRRLNCSMSLVASSAASMAFNSPSRPAMLSSLVRKRGFTAAGSLALFQPGEHLGKRLRRTMHQLVGQGLREGFHDFGRILAARERLEGVLEFPAAGGIGLVAQGANQRHAFAQPHPVHELADLGIDDRLGLLERRAARVEVGADDAGEIVDGVEEHVVE